MSAELSNESVNNENAWQPESALDVLIGLLYAEGARGHIAEPIEGITRLDKIMFLLSRDADFKEIINKGYKFEADNFGPFAAELFDDIEALKHEKILTIKSSREPQNYVEVADEEKVIDPLEDDNPSDTDFSVNVYQLTEQGLRVGQLLWEGLNEDQKEKLKNIKKTWQEKPLSNLLHYVYNKHPDTIVKSKIKDQVLNRW